MHIKIICIARNPVTSWSLSGYAALVGRRLTVLFCACMAFTKAINYYPSPPLHKHTLNRIHSAFVLADVNDARWCSMRCAVLVGDKSVNEHSKKLCTSYIMRQKRADGQTGRQRTGRNSTIFGEEAEDDYESWRRMCTIHFVWHDIRRIASAFFRASRHNPQPPYSINRHGSCNLNVTAHLHNPLSVLFCLQPKKNASSI